MKTEKQTRENNRGGRMIEEKIIELPQGWVCIGCGDEYLKDTIGKFVSDYTEGTICKKCNTKGEE